MSKNDTNRLLKDLCEMVEQDNSDPVYITVAAGGQLVTGKMITEDQFFSLSDNIALQKHFNEDIKAKRQSIMETPDDAGSVEFPEELKEWFIYLDDAHYISGGISIPTAGISMQIRVSDISVFTYRGLKV